MSTFIVIYNTFQCVTWLRRHLLIVPNSNANMFKNHTVHDREIPEVIPTKTAYLLSTLSSKYIETYSVEYMSAKIKKSAPKKLCVVNKTTLKRKKEGKATQTHLTHALAPKRKFPSCHEHPHHLQLSTESFARAKRCSLLCYVYWHRLLAELDDFFDFLFYKSLWSLWPLVPWLSPWVEPKATDFQRLNFPLVADLF